MPNVRACLSSLFILVVIAAPAASEPFQKCFDRSAGEAVQCSRLDPSGQCDLSTGKFAVVIGNNKYQNGLRILGNAEADARSMASVLHEKYGFTVRCILNATRNDSLDEFQFAQNVAQTFDGESDPNKKRLLIYFAGHGYNQSATSEGNIVFSNGPDESVGDASTQVSAIRQDLLDASPHVTPFMIIDACRYPISVAPMLRSALRSSASTTKPVVQTLMATSFDFHESDYFTGYSVPYSGLAADDEQRFTPYLVKELGSRGRSFWMMWDIARRAYNREHHLQQNQGPQCMGQSRIAMNAIFVAPADACDARFHTAWMAVAEADPDHDISDTLSRPLEKTNGEFATLCGYWNLAAKDSSNTNSSCKSDLEMEFGNFFQACSASTQIAMLDTLGSGPALAEQRVQTAVVAGTQAFNFDTLELAAARTGQRNVTARDLGESNGLSDRMSVQRENFRLDGKLADYSDTWREKVTTTKDSDLRLQPFPSERSVTPLAKGTDLEIDCESLKCGPDWLGVRYKPPGQKEPWRGFLPRADVAPATAALKTDVEFDQSGLVPTKDSLGKLDKAITDSEGRKLSHYRLSARYVAVEGDDAATTVNEHMALSRLTALDRLLRKRGLYTSGADKVRQFELVKVAGGSPEDVTIEFQ